MIPYERNVCPTALRWLAIALHFLCSSIFLLHGGTVPTYSSDEQSLKAVYQDNSIFKLLCVVLFLHIYDLTANNGPAIRTTSLEVYLSVVQ